MTSSNLYSTDDPIYSCFICGKHLRYSSNLSTVLEVESGSQHNCDGVRRENKIEDSRLSCQQRERELQAEVYGAGTFESSAQFSKPRVQTTKEIHERQAITEEHKRNISAGVRARFSTRISNVENNIEAMLSQGVRNKTVIAAKCDTSWITVRNYMRTRNIT